MGRFGTDGAYLVLERPNGHLFARRIPAVRLQYRLRRDTPVGLAPAPAALAAAGQR